MPIVHELRTLDDSLALRARIADGTARVVVIGAGFIGLEVAATARATGCAVTVLEGAPAPLIRGLGAEMGAAATAVHADGGHRHPLRRRRGRAARRRRAPGRRHRSSRPT